MEPHIPPQLSQTKKNPNKLSEADLLRLCLLKDDDLNLLGNLLYNERLLMNEKKEQNKIKKEKLSKKMAKKMEKNITPFHIPDAVIKNIHTKHQSFETSTQNDI